jgi:hypothetical protein
MAEVTYFVALPFVAADDGSTAGEPTEMPIVQMIESGPIPAIHGACAGG